MGAIDGPMLGETDVLLLAFLAGLAPLTLTRQLASLLAPMALLAGVIVVVGAWSRQSQRARVMHDFLPVLAIIAIFELLGPIIPVVNPARWDATFAALDARLFGQLPSAWFGALGRPSWLTDLASLAYVSYYPLPVVLAVALYARDRDAFRGFAFTVIATLLASFIGYLLFPTLGPRMPDDAALDGGAVTRAVRAFVQIAEGNPLDAFPSGHTAIALVCVGRGWRLFRAGGRRSPWSSPASRSRPSISRTTTWSISVPAPPSRRRYWASCPSASPQRLIDRRRTGATARAPRRSARSGRRGSGASGRRSAGAPATPTTPSATSRPDRSGRARDRSGCVRGPARRRPRGAVPRDRGDRGARERIRARRRRT
jgi:hypothetical protein